MRLMGIAKDPSFLQAHSEDQADLSLRWAHRSFHWFCHDAAEINFKHALTMLQIAKAGFTINLKLKNAIPR